MFLNEDFKEHRLFPLSMCSPGHANDRAGNDTRTQLLIFPEPPRLRWLLAHDCWSQGQFFVQKGVKRCEGVGRRERKEFHKHLQQMSPGVRQPGHAPNAVSAARRGPARGTKKGLRQAFGRGSVLSLEEKLFYDVTAEDS